MSININRIHKIKVLMAKYHKFKKSTLFLAFGATIWGAPSFYLATGDFSFFASVVTSIFIFLFFWVVLFGPYGYGWSSGVFFINFQPDKEWHLFFYPSIIPILLLIINILA